MRTSHFEQTEQRAATVVRPPRTSPTDTPRPSYLPIADHGVIGDLRSVGGDRGERLSNFSQAFTHLALISAAVNLDRRLG